MFNVPYFMFPLQHTQCEECPALLTLRLFIYIYLLLGVGDGADNCI